MIKVTIPAEMPIKPAYIVSLNMGLIREELFASRSMKIIWAARNGATKTNTLNFDAIPTPMRAPEIIEAFLFPDVATWYKKNNVHIENVV